MKEKRQAGILRNLDSHHEQIYSSCSAVRHSHPEPLVNSPPSIRGLEETKHPCPEIVAAKKFHDPVHSPNVQGGADKYGVGKETNRLSAPDGDRFSACGKFPGGPRGPGPDLGLRSAGWFFPPPLIVHYRNVASSSPGIPRNLVAGPQTYASDDKEARQTGEVVGCGRRLVHVQTSMSQRERLR